MRRPSAAVTVAGLVAGIVGFVLLAVEVVRALAGQSLSGVSTVLLWVGFGLLSAGLLTLFGSLTLAPADAGTGTGAADVPGAASATTAAPARKTAAGKSSITRSSASRAATAGATAAAETTASTRRSSAKAAAPAEGGASKATRSPRKKAAPAAPPPDQP